MEYLILVLFALAMLPGIVGVIIPILPGIPYMFVVALVYSFIDKFQKISTTEVIILFVLAIVSLVVDYTSGILGAKYGGASGKSSLAGIAGLITGLIVFPPFGGIAGLFIGILISELLLHKSQKKAIKAASGGLLGSLAGIVINFCVSLIFLMLFLIFSLK